jgi:hypothetical protein
MSAEPSPMRPSVPSRRFTLLDGLILIAPMAAGLAMVQPFFRDRLFLYGSTPSPRWLGYAGVGMNLASRFVAMGMLGVLVVRLLPPRPRLRRLSRQPGAVACAAGAAAMVVGGLVAVAFIAFRDQSSRSSGISGWAFFEARIGPAVMASWVALALSRRWRAEPSWVDRAGRILGAYWIALFLFRWFASFFWPAFWIEPF